MSKRAAPAKTALPTAERLALVQEVLASKKVEDILSLDLRSLGYLLCDYFVIGTAESDRQAQAAVDGILTRLKEVEGPLDSYRVEGYEVGQWILLDLGDIIVHVQQPEVRRYYRLEELWGDAKQYPYA